MDEVSEGATDDPMTVGARLKAAREEREQTLDDISRQTRVPARHLVQIEEGRLEGLPAAPYSAGFVKAYARAVELDPTALSHEFRAEFDRVNRATPKIAYEPYEPADPVRLPPRLLAYVALVIAILLAAGYAVVRSGILTGETREERAKLAASDETTTASTGMASGTAQPAAPVARGGAVQLIAVQPVWFEVTDRGTGTRLFTGVLDQGKTWDVPPSAADPVIKTGKPEGLAITVGGKPVAALGEPAHTISNVSLKGDSLLARPGAAVAPPAPTTAAPSPVATTAPPPTAADGAMPPAFRATASDNAATPQL